MAKKVNKSMVGVLAVFGFILMTVAGVLMVWQLRETDPQRFVDLAEARAKEGDLRQAQLYYNRAYRVSEDPKYLVLIGEISYKNGNEAAAVQAWERAVTQDPQQRAALTKLLEYNYELARTYPSQQTWAQVRDRAEALLAVDDQEAYGLYCKALALWNLRQQKEEYETDGFDLLRRAVEIAPENVEYGLALAGWEFERAQQAEDSTQSDTAGGDARYEALLATNTTPGTDAVKIRAAYATKLLARAQTEKYAARRARVARREAEKSREQTDAQFQAQEMKRHKAVADDLSAKALALLEEAVTLAGENEEDQASARVLVARYWFMMELRFLIRDSEEPARVEELTERIRKLLVEAIDIEPDGFQQYDSLAELYQAVERYDDAIEVCDQRAKRDIGRTGLKSSVRKQGIYRILLKAADMCLLQAGRSDDEVQRAELLDRAQQYVEDAKGEYPGGPWAMHAEGKVLLARGKDLDSLAVLEEADRTFISDKWENKLLLASLYLQQGQLGAAREAIEAAMTDRAANIRVWITAAEVYMRMKKYPLMAQAASQALRRNPDDLRARRQLASAYDLMGRPAQRDKELAKLPTDDPGTVVVKARALAREKEYSEALAMLAPLLETDPANRDAVRTAVGLHNRLGQPEQGLAVVDRAMAAKPDNVSLKLLKISLEPDLSSEERSARRLAVLENIQDAYARALDLAQFALDRGEYDSAQTHLREARRLLTEKATRKAKESVERYGERAMREIVDKQFVLSFRQADEPGAEVDWSEAEAIAADAAKRNLDGVGGLSYYGRLQLAQGNPKMAADSFSGALEKQPKNSLMLTFLAQAHLNLQQLEAAREAFEQAVVINPTNGLAHKGLAMLASNRRDLPTFTRHLQECELLIPEDSWVRTQLQLLKDITDPESGIARREEVRQRNPQDTENLLRLGELYTKMKPPEIDKARECYDFALENTEDRSSVIWIVASFYRANVDAEQALAILEAGVERETDPQVKAVLQTMVGRHLRETDQVEPANVAYLAAADLDGALDIILSVGQHFQTTRQLERALEWYTKAVARANQDEPDRAVDIRKQRIECLTALKRFDEASQEIVKLADDVPDDVTLPRLRADIQIRQGEFAKAITSLTLFLEKFPDSAPSLYMRAKCYTRLAKWPLAIVDLERLKARFPTVFELRPRKLLAKAYEMTNRLDLAASELEALVQGFPDNISVAEALVSLYRERGRYQDAERVLARLVNRAPDDPRWYAARAETVAQALREQPVQAGADLANAKEVARIVEDLRRASQISGFHPAFVARLLEVYAEFGPYDEGIRYFEGTLPPEQQVPPVIKAYATLLAKNELADQAVEQYRRATFLQTERRLAIAQAITKDVVAALGEERTLELFRKPPADERFGQANQLILAMILQYAGQYSEAITILEGLRQSIGDENEEAGLTVALGVAAGQAERHDEARRYYERALKLQPQNWVAANNLAYLLSEQLQEHQLALPYAREAALLNPVPTVLDTLGTVLTKLGKYREAVAELSQTIREDPKFVPGYYHLAEAYRCLEEFSDAKHLLYEARKLIAELQKQDRGAQVEEYVEPIDLALEKIRNRDSNP